MATINSNKEVKQAELIMYRDLVLATLDYYIEKKDLQLKTDDFDSPEYFKGLKKQADELFDKGRLTKLKQWFRDLTEMQVETRDFEFNKYLRATTNYEVDLFKSFNDRIDKIISKGKISTDTQFYDIKMCINQLSDTADSEKIKLLDSLLHNYEMSKKI